MKQLFAFALLVSLSLPAQAQEADETPDSLMERGAQMLLEGLLQRMEPTLDDLQGFAEEVGPALDSFLAEIRSKTGAVTTRRKSWTMATSSSAARRRKKRHPKRSQRGPSNFETPQAGASRLDT